LPSRLRLRAVPCGNNAIGKKGCEQAGVGRDFVEGAEEETQEGGLKPHLQRKETSGQGVWRP